ncbi:hypothetical protein ACQPXS_46840 (plasmid) [Streptomyces sp. CA-142005]|uniref:hypothetical protein n=1 Tax=Streptomyces sp. CA-142005 TaxID=3240052 RepID=UPI003D8DB013
MAQSSPSPGVDMAPFRGGFDALGITGSAVQAREIRWTATADWKIIAGWKVTGGQQDR